MDDYNLNPKDVCDEPRARNEGNEAFRDAQIGIGILDLDPEEEFPDYLRQGRTAIRQRADIAYRRAEASARDAGGGSVASHGSAAVFGRATRRTLEEITQENLDVVKKLRERMVQYDTKTPFMIPQGYSDTVSINGWEDRWDLSGEIIDLTINWGKLTLDHCCKWQRDFNGYSDDVDHISSIWTKDLLLNSMDPELRKVVEEKFLKLDAYQQGGITFLKILLDTVD